MVATVKVKVKDKEYDLDIKDGLMVIVLQELTNEIKKARMK